jgi:hypothetical protein
MQQIRDAANPNVMKIPFDPDRTPRAQIEAAIASLPPRGCEQHPHELQPVDMRTTVWSVLCGDYSYGQIERHIEFNATYERCAQCPFSNTDHEIEVERCAVGILRFCNHDLSIRDEKGRPLAQTLRECAPRSGPERTRAV